MPCPLVFLCVHVYVTFLLLHSIAFIAVLLFRSTTQDPLGLFVCRLRGAHEGSVCTNTLCRQSICAHKDLVERTKNAWGGFNLVHSLCGTDWTFVENVLWDGPHETFAHCLHASRQTSVQSLCVLLEVFVVYVGALVDANHICISSCTTYPRLVCVWETIM